MHISEMETPVAVVDLDRVRVNIERLQAYLDGHGIHNRPHIKTHKIPEIAHMQLAAGAVGITCQKLDEAEAMAGAGIQEIFLPYNILGERKLERLMLLSRRANLSVTADSEVVVRGLSAAASREGATLPVLVEFDSGTHRCGVVSPQQAADLARLIARAPGLRFGGLMTYPSTELTDPFVRETRALLRADGLALEVVSGGGTPKMWEAHTHAEVTEHRAGTYVYGDRFMLAAGAVQPEHCALSVITTVVSRPTRDRAILDGGSKTFSSDTLGLEGFGLILEYPRARLSTLSEEHGTVDLSDSPEQPEIGERVTVIPNHCCVVSNLFNQIIGVRNGVVEVTWPVAARGGVR